MSRCIIFFLLTEMNKLWSWRKPLLQQRYYELAKGSTSSGAITMRTHTCGVRKSFFASLYCITLKDFSSKNASNAYVYLVYHILPI